MEYDSTEQAEQDEIYNELYIDIIEIMLAE